MDGFAGDEKGTQTSALDYSGQCSIRYCSQIVQEWFEGLSAYSCLLAVTF